MRRSVAAIALFCLLSLTAGLFAQEERPQIPLGERKPTQKKDLGPRAVAVLRMSQTGKSSLEPIAILINGKFWDATAYKADPVPMALDAGTVYEAESSGSSLGLFTVNSALHSNAANGQAPWIATGAWHPTGMESAKPAIVAEAAPVGMGSDEAPPRLTHDTNATKAAPKTPDSSSGSTPPSSSSPPDSKSGSSDSGDAPPRLSKGSSEPPSPPTSATPSPAKNPAPSGTPAKTDSTSAGPSVPASDSGTDEANRPRLRRGRPPESFADENVDLPGYSKPGARNAAPPNGGKVEPAATLGDVKLIPAISDAGGPPPHSYAFEWLKGEEPERRKQMMDLAKQQLLAYVTEREKSRIQPKAAHASAAKHAATKPREPIFENVQMVAYDVWNSNQPVIILSATAHMPPAPAAAANAQPSSPLQYSILLVAYPDIYNNLHKLYSGVTDQFHLDMTPRLDLVDAVDADGDGRGELLFRETSDAGSGWAIYRATGDKLYKMFDSLNQQ